MSAALERRLSEGEGWRLVDVPLVGAAPWGFTLIGGREHQEPLIVTKVEEGSEAEAAQLKVGDELVSINGVILSGYRQEAICLVKSSYKALSLVVRRRIVSVSRHHSYQSTKVTDNQAETARKQTMTIPVRKMKCDSSSSDWKHPSSWDPNIMQQMSSSLGSMDYIEQSSHGYCSRGLRNSTDITDSLVGSLHGTAYSSTCFTAMNQSLTSENMACKPSQWDSNSRVNNGRLPHRSNTSQHMHKWPGFQELPIDRRGPENTKIQDPTEYQNFNSGKPPLGPVWHIPIKNPKAPSLLQASSDSFALTRTHKKGWTHDVPGSDGLDFHVSQKSQDQGSKKGLLHNNDITHLGYINNGREAEVKPSSSPPFKSGTLCPYTSPDSHNNDHPTWNNHHSLNSTDLQQDQPVCNPVLHDQHTAGDEIAYFPQNSYTSVSKTDSGRSCYTNVQEFPAESITPLFKYAHVTASSSAVSSTSISENLDHSKHSRYCYMTAQQSVRSLAVPQTSVKVGGIERGTAHEVDDHSSVHFQKVNKKNFLLSQEQQLYLERDEYEYVSGQVHNQSPYLAAIVETPAEKLKTENGKSSGEKQNTVDPQDSKEMQATQNSHSTGSNWFANNPGSEVQTRRTQVHKNKATVRNSETKENKTLCKDECRDTPLSSPEGSFISYKNHLKAAQTQVLKATSFSRKDLDPMLPDHLGVDVSDEDVVPYFMHQDKASMHACSKVLQDKPSTANVQVPCLGSHTCFPVEQKMHSFSAPDRINEVGAEKESPHPEAHRSSVNEYREFERTDKPGLPRSMVRSAKQSSPVDHPEIKCDRKLHPGKEEEGDGKTKAPFGGHPLGKSHSSFSSFDRGALQGSKWQSTPAEHQKTQSVKKNPLELVTPGRSLSADKSQDKHVDKLNKPSYALENHCTSTSEDFSRKNHPIQERGFTDRFLTEPAGQERAAARLYDRRYGDTTARGKSSPDVLETPAENTPVDDQEKRTSVKHPYCHPSEKPHSKDPEDFADKKKGPRQQKQCQSKLVGLKSTAPPKDPQGSLRDGQGSKPGSPCAELPLDLVVPWGSLSSCENPHQGTGSEDEPGALERAGVASSSFMECRLKLQLHTSGQQFSSHKIKLQVSVTIQDECRTDRMLENATVEEAAIMAFPAKDMEEEQHHHRLPNSVSSNHQLPAPSMRQSGLEHNAAESQAHAGVPGVSLQQRPLHFQRESPQPGRSRTTEECVRHRLRREKDTTADAASKVTDFMFSRSTAPAEEFQMGTKGMQEHVQEKDSELINSLNRKLQVLREAQDSVQEDMRANNALGEEVEQALQTLGTPGELDKFHMFVGDLDKVFSLLMSLTSRLDRVEKTLHNLGEQVSPKEKRSLLEKRKQLIQQHQDARELKKNLDHRERLLYDILANYLSEDRLARYVHFVKMKSALIIEQRKLEDKIRLREEQLRVLMDRLLQESRYTFQEDLLLCPDLLI